MNFQSKENYMKYCKRIALTLLAMLSVAMVSAQDITIKAGEKGNSKGYQPTMIVIDKADAEGRYYSVEPDLNAFSKVKGVMVREVDMDYKEYQKVAIANTKGNGIMHVQRDGTKMHLVLSNYDDKRLTLRHVCVDLASFAVVSDSMLVDIMEKKGDFFYHWDGTSASGNYYGLVYANVNEKAGTADVQAMLFDRSMRRQWTQGIALSAIADIFVTDDGRIALGGYSNGDGRSDGAMLEFAITTATGTRRGRHTSVYKLGSMALLNCIGDKVLATALETDRGTGWAGSFNAGAVVTTGTVYTGCASYLFDVAEDRMAGSDRRTFSRDDARVFYNASLVSEIASPDINFLSLRASTPTSYGGAALYGRNWHEKVVQGNGMSSETYYFKGMMVFAADSTGRFTWVRPVMHDNGTGGIGPERTESDLVAEGDKVYLFTNESDGDADSYDSEKPARKAVMKAHGAVSAYIFSPDGNVVKRKIKTDGMNIITTPLRRQSPGVYTFVSGAQKGHVSEITVKP